VRDVGNPAVGSVPEDFVRLVQDALGHLHDPVHLQRHPLIGLMQPGSNGGSQAGRALQQRVLAEIKELRPDRPGAPGERLGRGYRILQLRYLEGLDPQDVQRQLGVGKSQYYLDSARAIAALASLLWAQMPRSRSDHGPHVSSELTRPWTSFIGRDEDLASLQRLLLGDSRQRPRLVTLTGPGGVGKTRLAIECATALHAQGTPVAVVELASVREAALVVPSLASAIGVHESGGEPLTRVLQHELHDRDLLLVLDNFEHVAEAANEIAQLLRGTTRLQVLATSRMPLRVYGEREILVAPLSTRRGNGKCQLTPAEQLFVDRARAIKSDFDLTPATAEAVYQVCVRLDGLPLAIELAAARMRLLSPAALRDHLDQRLAVLVGGTVDMPQRHQTLRATIDWSFGLLTESEQVLFRRLAVFAGSFRLEAANGVVGFEPLHDRMTVLDALTSVAAKSLLREEPTTDPDGEGRFAFLQTVREYALERLEQSGEREALLERMARYYLDLVQIAESHLAGLDQAAWLERVERSLDNVRASLHWWSARDPETGLRHAVALSRFWLSRALSEGRTWLEQLLARAPSSTDAVLRARALETVALISRQQGDYQGALSVHADSLALFRAHGDARALARSLFELGVTLFYKAELAASRPLFEESLAMARQAGDLSIIGQALFRLANLAHLAGEYPEAVRLHQQGLQALREVGDRRAVADSLFNLGYIAVDQGDAATAAAYLNESLGLMLELNDPRGLAWVLEGYAGLAAPIQPERAVRLAGAAARLRDEAGFAMPPAGKEHFEHYLEPARGALRGDAWAAAWEDGRTMSREDVVAELDALEASLGNS
jgi:predicted ATPase